MLFILYNGREMKYGSFIYFTTVKMTLEVQCILARLKIGIMFALIDVTNIDSLRTNNIHQLGQIL